MKYNEIINKVNKAKTLKTVKKYGEMLGVNFGNTKDINKARNRVINKAITERDSISQEVVKNKQKAFNKALERYQKTAEKHNRKAMKMLNYGMEKIGKYTSNVRDYLIGKELDLSQTRGITYQRANTPFAIEDYENIEFSSIKAINNRIKTLGKLDKRLTKKQINKELSANEVSKEGFENKLQGYVDAGDITENDKELLMERFNSLNGLQQEVMLNNVIKSMPNKYPKPSKEESEEITVNLLNKLNREIDNISTYF